MLQFLHCTEVTLLWLLLPTLCGAVCQERCPCLYSHCVVGHFLCHKDVGGTVDTQQDGGVHWVRGGRGREGKLCAIALIKGWSCFCTFLLLAIVKDQSYELCYISNEKAFCTSGCIREAHFWLFLLLVCWPASSPLLCVVCAQ